VTSRDRVAAAFAHRAPDRTPFFEKLIKSPILDLVLGRPSIGHNFVTRMEALEHREWEEIVQAEAEETAETVARLGMDLVRLGTNLGRDFERPRRLDECTWETAGEVVRYIPGSPWVEHLPKRPRPTPEQEEADLIRWLEGPWQPPTFPDEQFAVFQQARALMAAQGLDPAIFVSCYTMPVCTLPRPAFAWFHDRPALLHEYYRRCSGHALALIPRMVELGADIVGLGGDLASDHGPLISPRQYAEFVGPHIREQAALVHSLGRVCTTASDGDLWPIAREVLLAPGVDGFEEIDHAAGMDLARLKRAFGDRLTFIGNVDERWTLCRGTPEETRAHVHQVLEAGALTPGGHILMCSNCIHEDVRPENFQAYVEAYREHFGLPASPVFAGGDSARSG